jgi:phage FluMu protein Com
MSDTKKEEIEIPCPKCKRINRFIKADYWGKVFRCVHCAEIIDDRTRVNHPPI